MKYNGLVISDIHVGAFDVAKLYEEFENVFIDYIKKIFKKNIRLDFVIITGDFFDHKFYLNDRKSLFAYKMIKRLCDLCSNKTKIRIVYGTESHECNQYDIVDILSSKNSADTIYDIKVIKTVTVEKLFDDLNILYLPEEYMEGKDRFYQKFFKDNEYNYVFGHGIIREVMKDAVAHTKTSKDNKRAKVPIFTTSELDRICKGEVYFGHYHINREIDDKIFSVGSFSRWKFGEEERKGFYHISYDSEKDKYTHTYIENTLAESYITINYGYNSKVFSDNKEMEKNLSNADKLIETDSIDHIRFQFNIPIDVKQPESIINYVKERYKYNDKVKINIINGYIEEKKEQSKKEILEENKKYSFIYDDSPIEKKVSHYILIEKNKDIDYRTIDIYLTNSIEEIIEKTIVE